LTDLSTGPLTRHLLKTTNYMLATMIFQTLYFLPGTGRSVGKASSTSIILPVLKTCPFR
jgi:hypothetical protein